MSETRFNIGELAQRAGLSVRTVTTTPWVC